MATIPEVMTGIQTRLRTINGLHVTEYEPNSIIVPMAFVGVPPVSNFQVAYSRGKYDLEPTVTVLTSSAIDKLGQMALAGYILPVANSIHADPTLDGVAESAEVTDFRPLGIQEVSFFGYFGGLFTLRVMATFTP